MYSSLYLCSHPEFSNTDTIEFSHKNVTGEINSWFIAEMFRFKGDFFHCVGLNGGLSVLVGILTQKTCFGSHNYTLPFTTNNLGHLDDNDILTLISRKFFF